MNLVYLVHDLADPAVQRRVRLLLEGGLPPRLLGFHRGHGGPIIVAAIEAVNLGVTANARLGRRTVSILRCAVTLGRWKSSFVGASVIVARNLEMLLLASWARARFAPTAALVYECLDVHTLLVEGGAKGWLMRGLEGYLLKRCNLLIVSSPFFVSEHFEKRYLRVPPVLLVENKLLASEFMPSLSLRRHRQPPWRIGWFGVLRCRRSLMLLVDLVRSSQGQIEVDIRGKPALNIIADFHAIVDSTPGMVYFGPYNRSTELLDIYQVDFTWAFDFYEIKGNSNWLLPNRLYEGGAFGAVHLALRPSATGHWLANQDVGVLFSEPLGETLSTFFHGLTEIAYSILRDRLLALNQSHFVASSTDAINLVAALRSAQGEGAEAHASPHFA